jgi:N-acetylglucosamine kinase-like BadF-type ATPase
MKRNGPVFIGIDGGGTYSFAMAVDSTGRRLATAEAGSLNFFGAGLPTARRHLKELSESLERQLPPTTQIARIVVGCAALFSDATKAEKENLCRGILPLARTRVVSDCQTACFGATLGRPGVVIIAGTGSIVVAQNEDGQHQRVGGWGHILGDQGSAYWLAVESVKAAVAAEEGAKTHLGRLVRQWFKVSKLTEIVPIIHGPDFTKERFATLASHLARKVGGRDTAFREICQRAAHELASQALAAVNLARVKTRPLPVYLVGGVLANNALVRACLVTALTNSRAVRIVKPRLSPLLGAAALALGDARVELTVNVVSNLAMELCA